MAAAASVGSGFQAAEEIGLGEDHAGGVGRSFSHGGRVGHAAGMRYLDDLHPESGRERPHHFAHLRIERLGDDNLVPPGRLAGDQAGICGDGGAVVARRVGDVHSGELADRRLILEDSLQRPLAHLGLIRRVRRQDLSALSNRVDHCRHVVVVDACSEKRQLQPGVDVSRRQLGEMLDQLELRQRGADFEIAPQPEVLGEICEQRLDRVHPDRL